MNPAGYMLKAIAGRPASPASDQFDDSQPGPFPI